MKSKFAMGFRYFLGAIFFIFGLNGLHPFLPMPQPQMSEEATAFMTGMMATKYFFPFLKITEVVVGLALLTNMFVPLALVVLAPITINIFLFHTIIAPEGMGMAVVIAVAHAYLGWFYKNKYSAILKAK